MNPRFLLHRTGLLSLAGCGLALALLAGCVSVSSNSETAAPAATNSPADYGPKGSAPITFTRLVFRISPGADLGAHHDGVFKLVMFHHTWNGGMLSGGEEFKLLACDQMRLRDYTVLGGENVLFGKDDSAKAEYQLGGSIQTLQLNTYGQMGGNYSEASLSVDWQLNDTLKDQIVFKKTTSGSAHVTGVTPQCVKNAFVTALDQLLCDPEFVRLLKQQAKAADSTNAPVPPSLEIAAATNTACLSLPADMETAMKSVLLIHAGGAVGSGVIISEDGYALTAAHVVSPLKEVSVHLRSGLVLDASVVRVDNEQDIALIKLPGHGHAAINLATNALPQAGSELYAIGAPAGDKLSFSVSKGVVSGYREDRGRHFLQTDAALNPGNSGGPLIAADGRLVAIVSWKIVAPGFEGLSFGVPVSSVADRLHLQLK